MQIFAFMLIFTFAGFLIFMGAVHASGYKRKGCGCRVKGKKDLKNIRIRTKL